MLVLLALPALGVAGGVAAPPSFATHVAPGWAPESGEPSVGVNPRTGAVLVQDYATTLKVAFDAAGNAQWSDVTPPRGLGANLDPILFTDPATGVTTAGGLEGECSVLWQSADDGASWTPLANPCSPPAFDHETVATGPLGGGLDALPGARAAYYCAQLSVIQCAASVDGGLTFGAPVPVSPGVQDGVGIPALCTGPSGHVKVAPQGTVYVPSSHCQTRQGVAVSDDRGLTWRTRAIPGSTVAINTFDASVATTPSGWAYVAWEGANQHQYVTLTKDHGAHWGPNVDVSAPAGLRATAFSAMVAGDDARAAVAFLGTSDAGQANDASFQGAWWLYVAFTYDGGATWTTVRASPDPVQYGWICSGGIGCPGQRNLLDFLDASVDPQGRVLVAYADGCPPGCASVAASWHARITLARQAGGDGLFG